MEDFMKLKEIHYSILTNKNAFFLLPLLYNSRYFGLLLPYRNYYIKVIDRIENERIKEKKIEEIILENTNKIKINYEDRNWEEYQLLENKLVYKTKDESRINILFDIRHLYDIDEWGRIYNYEINKEDIKIKFNKGDINFEIYIKGFKNYLENNEKWIKVFYNYDEYKKSPPFERYLYSPFTFIGNKIEIIWKKEENKREKKKSLIEERISSFINNNHISAGFPWYFQEWTRDVLISLPGLYYIGYKDLVKEKIIEYSNYFLLDGRLKNIKDQNIGNSDGIGLYAKRLFEFNNLFNEDEFKKLVNIIIEKLKLYEENYLNEKYFLFKAYPNETWMDTLNREYPIEIQFLMANLYDNLYKYNKNEEYKEKLDKIKFSIRRYYLSDYSLYDDLKDKKIRCNIFLSYYYYPEMFSNYEWEKIFDYSMNHLYLFWGGFSSLSKLDKDFIGESNEDNYFKNEGKSMHNGDSWIYINNIAAISLYKVNKEKYEKIIENILNSDNEFIKMIGTLPERSSANEMKIAGAIHQLWSLATYIELKEIIK
jgi:glycogen debranching enzyme